MTNENYMTPEELQYYKKIIARGEALERLSQNQDFKDLILTGLIQNTTDTLVTVLAQAGKPESRDELFKKLLGISYVKQYLGLITAEAERAKETLNTPVVEGEVIG